MRTIDRAGGTSPRSSWIGLRFVSPIALLMAGACGQPPASGDPPDAGGDHPASGDRPAEPIDVRTDGDTADPFCHYDCFGFTECQDGVVTQWAHSPVPCAYWTGQCPHQIVGQCQKGCGVDRIQGGFSVCPLTICREYYPKSVGDSCQDDADCSPTQAVKVAEADGGTDASSTGVHQTYLRCDQPSGKCVETAAPVIPDWLGPCDPAALANLEKGSYGAAVDPSCSGGKCLVLVPHDRTCIYQGCSGSCTTDADCPQGAVCQEAPPIACGASPTARGYCKPGPVNQIGIGLTCR